MRKLWFVAAAACLVPLPGSAFAAIYDFKSTESSALGNPAFNFALDTSIAVDTGGGTSFSGVTIDDSGVRTTGNTVSLVTSTELASSLFFFVDTDVPGPKLFSVGSGTDITFNPGTFSIADGFTDGEGTLTITNTSVSAVPEPPTWLLMIAGIGGIGLMLRQAERGSGACLDIG